MPDLLREQFPHFRPIVEAFGYRNLEFEGWEADDVIATLATRADEAGLRTCVVSTDRDAFQLCSENVCLMMTPRGVADVQVYTPERVEARYGVRPEQVPDFIGLKGDTSDNIPGVPGIGDKTAGELIGRYGSLEAVIEHAAELSPARARAIVEHADQARVSKELATMRRDLELDFDPGELVLAPPDRSQLKEIFRRFEFRGLLAAARHARRGAAGGGGRGHRRAGVAGARASCVLSRAASASPPTGDRAAVATGRRRRRRPATGPRSQGELVVHDAKSLGVDAADDTLIAAYLIEPGRGRVRARRPRAPSTGSSCSPSPPPTRRRRRSCVAAELPRRLAPPDARPARRSASLTALYREIELPLTRVLAEMEQRRRQDRHLPDGRDHRPARRAGRGARGARLRARRARSSCSARPSRSARDPVRAARARRRAARARRATRPTRKVLRAIRGEHAIVAGDRGVARAVEAAQHLPRAAAGADRRVDGRLHTTINQTVAATGRLSTTNPNLQAIPIRTELGREIRSAFVAEEGAKLVSADYSQIELRILAHVSGEPKLREAFARGEDIHRATAAEVLGKDPATLTTGERTIAKMINFGIVYGISAFGLSENLEIPREQAQAYIDAYLARFPHVQDFIARTIEQATRDGYVTTLLGRRRPVPEIRASNRQTR